MDYYYIVIDKLNKTLQVKKCNSCLAVLMDEVKEEHNFATRWEVENRFRFFFNNTESKINFDTIYKYAKKYTVLA